MTAMDILFPLLRWKPPHKKGPVAQPAGDAAAHSTSCRAVFSCLNTIFYCSPKSRCFFSDKWNSNKHDELTKAENILEYINPYFNIGFERLLFLSFFYQYPLSSHSEERIFRGTPIAYVESCSDTRSHSWFPLAQNQTSCQHSRRPSRTATMLTSEKTKSDFQDPRRTHPDCTVSLSSVYADSSAIHTDY